MFSYDSEDQSNEFSAKDSFIVAIYQQILNVLNKVYSQIEWHSEGTNQTAEDFQLLSGHFLAHENDERLKQTALNFALKYNKDAYPGELHREVIRAKNMFRIIRPTYEDAENLTHKEILQLMLDYK